MIWAAAAAIFVLAGAVKGVVGMGLPTVSMGLLATIMPPAQAAALLLIPSFVTNVWQLMAGPALRGLWRRLWTMLAGVVVGTVASAGLLTGAYTGLAKIALGATLVVYAGLGLLSVRFVVRPASEPWLSPLVGLATGLVTGATGVFVVPAVPYLQALQFERDDLIQALGLSFTVSTVALAIGLSGQGMFGASLAPLGLSLLALVPAMLGMLAGQYLRGRMQGATFRRVFFVGLLLLGLYLSLPGLART